MCSYKSLLPQPCSQYSETERRTRQKCAATSSYCLSPVVMVITGTERRTRQECAATSPLLPQPCQSVLRDGEKNQIGMCSYKSLLTQPCSRDSQTERRTRQECAATSSYCLSPAVGNHRQREELDRNVQLQVLIASVLQSVLRDREKNQIGMCSYKSLLPQSPVVSTNRRERRTRQECAATSPYCLRPVISTVETERRTRYVQLQVLIASALQSVLRDREKNQIGMFSYKSLLPQPCQSKRQYYRRQRALQSVLRTRQECSATSPY